MNSTIIYSLFLMKKRKKKNKIFICTKTAQTKAERIRYNSKTLSIRLQAGNKRPHRSKMLLCGRFSIIEVIVWQKHLLNSIFQISITGYDLYVIEVVLNRKLIKLFP